VESFTGTVKVGKVVASVPTGWLGDGRGQKKAPARLERCDLQPGFEAVRHGTARIGKSGLSSRVVFHMELEGDSVSRLGNNGVGLERKNAGATDDNTVIRTGGGGRRIHDDWSGGGSRRSS
jgi:hypothetical protein